MVASTWAAARVDPIGLEAGGTWHRASRCIGRRSSFWQREEARRRQAQPPRPEPPPTDTRQYTDFLLNSCVPTPNDAMHMLYPERTIPHSASSTGACLQTSICNREGSVTKRFCDPQAFQRDPNVRHSQLRRPEQREHNPLRGVTLTRSNHQRTRRKPLVVVAQKVPERVETRIANLGRAARSGRQAHDPGPTGRRGGRRRAGSHRHRSRMDASR